MIPAIAFPLKKKQMRRDSMSKNTRAWIDARHQMVNCRLWGLTLLERNLRQLYHLGIRQITVFTTGEADPLGQLCHPLPPQLQVDLQVAGEKSLPAALAGFLQQNGDATLLLEGHALNDRRVLQALVETGSEQAALFASGENGAVAALLKSGSAGWLRRQSGENLPEILAAAHHAGNLSAFDPAGINPYIENLRREIPPYLLRIENETHLRQADRLLRLTVHKGVLELVAKYIHPPLEFGGVRLIDETEISPNQITILWLILAALTVPLFMKGYLLTGLILAAVSGVLDGIDGKLARLTLRYSKVGDRLDHIGGAIYDGIWYLALGWYFSAGDPQSTGALFTYLLVISYVFHRLIPGLFRNLHGQEIYDYRRIDVIARLVGARMNNNIWLLLIGVSLGFPRESYYLMCSWMALTALWFIARFTWVCLRRFSLRVNPGTTGIYS